MPSYHQIMLTNAVLLLSSLAAASAGKTALVLIDVQDCFTSTADRTGSLEVAGAMDIIPVINEIREKKSCLFDYVFLSQDYHPSKHVSFASTHNVAFTDDFSILQGTNTIELTCLKPESGKITDAACCLMDEDKTNCAAHGCSCDSDNPACSANTANSACTTCADDMDKCFKMTQALWPDHCGSWETGGAGNDAGFVASLALDGTETVIQKGKNQLVDAYSVFMDNTKTLKTSMDDELKAKNVTDIYVAGIATDFCVKWSIEDAVTLGYNTKFISDASKGIVSQTLSSELVPSITSAELLALECPEPTASEAGETNATSSDVENGTASTQANETNATSSDEEDGTGSTGAASDADKTGASTGDAESGTTEAGDASMESGTASAAAVALPHRLLAATIALALLVMQTI